MKRYLLVACLASCSPGPRDQTPQEIPDAGSTPDAVGLPAGAWEPDPGLGRTDAIVLADGSDLWFVYARVAGMGAGHVWMTKTTSTGEVLVPPVQVDDGPGGRPMAAALSGENVAVVWATSNGGQPATIRMVDASGQPLGAGHSVPMSGVVMTYTTNVVLAAREDGSMRLFAAYDNNNMATELAMVELDAAGNPVGDPELFGVADVGTPIGLAVAESEGSTLVAWDRRYDICQGHLDPDATLVTTVANDGTLATIADVHPSGLDDFYPTLAALGSNAYLAWTAETDAGWVIRASRATDPAVGYVELGNPSFGNRLPMLALADSTHGAIAWRTDEPAIRVAGLSDDGTNLTTGIEHPIALPSVHHALRGIVHVGGDRYLVTWTEDLFSTQAHLYALVVDLAAAPMPAPAAPPSGPHAPPRCSH